MKKINTANDLNKFINHTLDIIGAQKVDFLKQNTTEKIKTKDELSALIDSTLIFLGTTRYSFYKLQKTKQEDSFAKLESIKDIKELINDALYMVGIDISRGDEK